MVTKKKILETANMKLFKGLNIEVVLDESIPEGEIHIKDKKQLMD